MKKNNKKGFTLAELLIVVAIIAVLVAIAIPVFTTQLEKSRESTDLANVRSAYAAVVTKYLDTGSANSVSISAEQKNPKWQNNGDSETYPLNVFSDGGEGKIEVSYKNNANYVVVCDGSGNVSVN